MIENLWAPWRASYIRKGEKKSEGCIFCEFPQKGPASYKEHFILYSSEKAFVIFNLYPYNAGHLMVIPRRHVSDLSELPKEEYQALCELLQKTVAILKQELLPEGMNLGMNLGKAAGAGIADHCHFHVVPRWNGDTNFMPVVAETKVIGKSLGELYQKLLPAFKEVFG